VDRPGEVSKAEVVFNNTLSLTCPAAGTPTPEITWFYNGQPIPGNTSEFRLLQDGWKLEVVSAQLQHSARWVGV